MVSKLVEMGFAKGHAASGVRANHGKSEEQIVQWLHDVLVPDVEQLQR